MNLKLERNNATGAIEIRDLDNANFRKDVSSDFKRCMMEYIAGKNEVHNVPDISEFATDEFLKKLWNNE